MPVPPAKPGTPGTTSAPPSAWYQEATPQQAGESVAEAAFAYADGHPDTETARRYGRSVTWTCGSCDKLISDHGLWSGPADDERGHGSNCPRLAATIAAWDAECDALDADWEAGR